MNSGYSGRSGKTDIMKAELKLLFFRKGAMKAQGML
jgi:hypothetical protein